MDPDVRWREGRDGESVNSLSAESREENARLSSMPFLANLMHVGQEDGFLRSKLFQWEEWYFLQQGGISWSPSTTAVWTTHFIQS